MPKEHDQSDRIKYSKSDSNSDSSKSSGSTNVLSEAGAEIDPNAAMAVSSAMALDGGGSPIIDRSCGHQSTHPHYCPALIRAFSTYINRVVTRGAQFFPGSGLGSFNYASSAPSYEFTSVNQLNSCMGRMGKENN